MENKIVIRGDAKEVMKMFDDIQKGAKQTEKVTETTTKGMKLKWEGLGTAVNAVMGGLGLKVAADMIKSSERMGLALDILKVKNKDVYNQLQQTEKATFGLANQFDMVTAANKALAFGIDLSDGKLNKLTKISTKLAAVMGIDVKQAFDDLIVSSARQQKLIADNLGIMIDKVRVDTAYAKQLGITKGALTEQQQSQAFLNEILKKGNIITAELGDEFIKTRTKGTQALKALETVAKTTLNGLAFLFVGVGDTMAYVAASIMTLGGDLRSSQERELDEFNRFRIDAEKVTLAELRLIRAKEKEAGAEYNSQVMESWRKYYKELQELKDFYDEEIMYAKQADTFAKRQKQGRDATKLHYEKLAKLNAAYNLKVIEGRELDFVSFKSHLVQQLVLSDKYFSDMAKMIKKTSLFGYASTSLTNYKAQIAQEKQVEELKIKKQKEWWAKNKARKEAEKKAEISMIISFNKDKIGFSDKSNEEQIRLGEKYAQQEKALLTKKISELKALKLQAAKELDIKVGTDKTTAQDKINKKAIFDAEVAFNTSMQDLTKRNAEQVNSIKMKDAQEALALKKAQIAQEQALQMKANSFYVGAAKDVLVAVINGNAAAIPEMLAQKAFMYGTDLVMDGIMHQLAGTAKLASPLTAVAGAFEIKAGSAEVAQGLPWMLGGGLAVAGLNLMGSSGGGSSSDTSKTTGAEDRNEFNQAVNTEEKEAIIVYQYPSEKEYLDNLKKQSKKIARGF